ncbi:ArsI/CadI family heavy metal resistance metalloenzyme [Gimesia sp.]|uniref:ArsI/CadI family heavy metal resistance metalloenzyme n=1 Tax=Gimesia sp. TaxID=2024833 RepID=UPI0032F075FD
MTFSDTEQPVHFHISLNVADIPRSVAFFAKVFGIPATKQREDYAKFELNNPPLTLSLEPVDPGERGALNHLGFRLNSAEELVALQRRLELAGISSQREEGVECCYAKQSKFWLHDPDQNLWEMYLLEGDLEHRGAGQVPEAVRGETKANAAGPTSKAIVCSTGRDQNAQQKWAHRLGQPLEIPADLTPESLDDVALQGSFNAEGTADEVRPFLKQVANCLKPGGTLNLHCLTGDRRVTEALNLAGPASVVKQVPVLESLLADLEAAGFERISLTTYRRQPCFTVGEAELRETRLQVRKPEPVSESQVNVVYLGPFAELSLDQGLTLKRGRQTMLPANVYQQLQASSLAESVLEIEAAASPISCSS